VQTQKYLREIHESLSRMTRTVQALKNVRRIVLTDYVAGVKMLDLEQSAKEEPADVEQAVAIGQSHGG
jgi:pyruvate-formate lyase-activating enzyme